MLPGYTQEPPRAYTTAAVLFSEGGGVIASPQVPTAQERPLDLLRGAAPLSRVVLHSPEDNAAPKLKIF